MEPFSALSLTASALPTDKAYVNQLKAGAIDAARKIRAHAEELHAMDHMTYAYLQTGQDTITPPLRGGVSGWCKASEYVASISVIAATRCMGCPF